MRFSYTQGMSLPNSLNQFHAKTFIREGRTLSGHAQLHDFPRLQAETVLDAELQKQSHVEWRLQGQQRQGVAGGQQDWLLAEASASIYMPCQRCLQPVAVALQTEQWFRFVDTPEQADLEDAESDEDVLTYAEAEDAHALLEDDLLMALPMNVKHEACEFHLPQSTVNVAGDGLVQEERKNPFAILEQLRSKESEETDK